MKTSNYVIVPIKFSLDVGNDEYIFLGNFGGRIMSGFEIIGVRPPKPFPGCGKQKNNKSPVSLRVKPFSMRHFYPFLSVSDEVLLF